jgi:Glycosyl transferases group 1
MFAFLRRASTALGDFDVAPPRSQHSGPLALSAREGLVARRPTSDRRCGPNPSATNAADRSGSRSSDKTPSTSRNKVSVYAYGAFSPESDGSHARVCSLLDRLSDTFGNVAVYSYDNHPDFPWKPANVEAFRARWPHVELVLEPYTAKLKMLTRLKNLLISIFPNAADRLLQISVRGWSPGFTKLKVESQAIFVNYTHGLNQLNGIDPKRCLVDTHDVNFAKWAKITDSSSVSTTSLRKLRGEIAALQPTGAVIAISPSEAAFFRMMLNGSKVFYVSTWTAPRTTVPDAARATPDIDLVFVGSGYIMNSRGLCDMFERHGNWLSRFRIAVCGLVCNDPDVIALARRFPKLSLLGYVERPGDIYARSKAALSPVDGTGLKMKIMAAMEAGIPAFASAQAFDGLPPGYENSVFPISESSVTGLLASEQRLAEARKAALSYYTKFNQTGEVNSVLDRLRSFGLPVA